MAFTSIQTTSGITTIKITALSDISGIALERSGDGYVVKYTGTLAGKVDDALQSTVTKVRVVLGVGTLESVQKEYSLGLNVGEVRVDPTNPLKTEWGSLMRDQHHYAWINGTPGSDTYDFTDTTSPSSVSSATRALMDADKRGIWVDLGNGNDTAKGSSYGDNFNISGTGLKKIDGGNNEGQTPWGNKATDSVEVFIKIDSADYNNTTVIETLVATINVSAVSSTDTNGAGYTHVLKRGDTVLAYLKNIEQVNIQIWKDFNDDGRVQWDADPSKNESKWAKNIQLAVNVGEIRLDPNDATKTDWGIALKDAWHFAWINGTLGNDDINATELLSTQVLGRMETYSRGVWIDAGAGNDNITGTVYSDNILGGSGNDKVDGGTNISPASDKGQDVFEIRLTANDQTTAQALLSKIKVLPSNDTNYTWMVQHLDGSDNVVETDYLKNVEAVNISVNHPSSNQWLAGRWQSIALDVGEIRLDKNDPAKTEWGSLIKDQMHFAWVNGNSPSESFDYTGPTAGAATVSAKTKQLMAQYERGLWVDMGGGNDKIVGSPYGDNFSIYASDFNILGSGLRYIDGGENKGKTPWGNNASDNLDVFVANQTAANSIKVMSLSSSAAAESVEGAAKTKGYTSKVLAGDTVIAYVKDIEYVNIQIWNDRNNDGQRQWDRDSTKNEMTWVSNVRLVVDVSEIRVSATDNTKTDWGTKLSDAFHMAWINGTESTEGDSIVVKSLVSDKTQSLQALYKRGLFVDGGSGPDTIVGSDYSDNINGGAGNDLIDGGKNLAPTGERGQDVFEIRLVAADTQEANTLLSRIKVLPTTSTDTAGYSWKVVQYDDKNTIIQTDYLKNIESVSINVNTPSNQWLAGRWQTISLNVGELRLDKTDPTKTEWGSKVSDQMHFAWVNGTPSNESFDYTGTIIPGAETVSAPAKALMDQYKRGLWVDLGAGTDEMVGSPYGDNFNISGSGIRFIDGGLNEGKTSWGNRASDNLDVFVANSTLAATVKVKALDESPQLGTPEAVAKAKGYTGKVLSGEDVLAYIKDIEWVNVQIWDDKNGDGQRQWDSNNNKNEMIWYGNFRLAVEVNEMRINPTDSSKTDWGTKVADQYHFAWINGTDNDDVINAKTLVSAELLALQTQYKRGLSIQAGAGKDTITGSDFSDNIEGGAGDDKVDGGTQIAPGSERGQDVFQIQLIAENVTQANALMAKISVVALENSEYQWKVIQKNDSGEVIQTDLLKNIEAVSINVNNANNQWITGRWQNLALNVGEIRLSATDPTKTDYGQKLADQFHFAWVNGTPNGNEQFDYTGKTVGAETVSEATKKLMAQYGRGLWVDLLGGTNDIAVGSPYGDNFNIVAANAGVAYLDGADNSGSPPWGGNAQDTLEIFIRIDEVASSVQVVPLINSVTAEVSADSLAIGKEYTHKVTKGNVTLAYIKNIERVVIHKWEDKDNNAQRDWDKEVTKNVASFNLSPSIGYQNNGDATKNAVWIDGTPDDDKINVADFLKKLPTSSDPKLNWAGTKLQINVNLGSGNTGVDTVIGSDNSDMITPGGGITYVDGGGNTGRQTWANNSSSGPYDSLQLIAMNELEARSIKIEAIAANGSDSAAYNKGYRYKASMEGNTKDFVYFVNVEQIAIKVWTDINGDKNIQFDNEIINYTFLYVQTPVVSWVTGERGNSVNPPTSVFIFGSKFTNNINANTLIDEFVAGRIAYPTSPSDLPASFKFTDIANTSASFGAHIMAGSGDHQITGTDYTDYIVIDPVGNNLLNGGSDIGYWMFGGALNVAQDRVRITEEVQIKGVLVDKSFIKIAAGATKAFSTNNTASTADDVNGTYTLRTTDKLYIHLLPKSGKVGFKGDIEAARTALSSAATLSEFQTALTTAKAIADVHYSVFKGVADLDENSKNELFTFGHLGEPTFTSTEAQFAGSTSNLVTNPITAENLLSKSRFDENKHHLINLSDNSLWSWSDTSTTAAPASDMAAILAFANSKNVVTSDYNFALVTYSEFDASKVVGVQLMKDIEQIEFRLWFDTNLDNRQSGGETSSTYLIFNTEADFAIHKTADLGTASVGGKLYAGTYLGTSKTETINAKTSMQAQIGLAEQTKKIGVRIADFWGDDTVTGTDLDDLFLLGNGVDTFNGGNGSDRMAFFWIPTENATLTTTQDGNVVKIWQRTAANNTATELARITLTETGGTIQQMNSTFADAYGASAAFAEGTPDTFTGIEELIILLDSSLKNADGSPKYTTGNVTDSKPFIVKLKPTAEYPTGSAADATKNSITFSGSPYADNLDASALLQSLPTSSIAKDDWRNSSLNTNILLNGGGDVVKGTANADMIDPGTGTNYIDGGTNFGRTNWIPTWIDANRAYWGAESATDHVRFYIKDAASASNLNLIVLKSTDSGADGSAFEKGYKIKATFTDGAGGISTNYLKDVEYVGLRLFNDSNGNNLRDLNETSSTYSYFAVNTPIVNWRFLDLNDTAYAPCYFDFNVGKFVTEVNAQSAIDTFIANKKNFPVIKEDKVSLDVPANYKLSDFINYSKAYGANIQVGNGDHVVTGTDYTDYFVVGNYGSNWIDGGLDTGYVKYETSPGKGTITASRDLYRVAHTVNTNDALSGTISKTNYKVIRLSDKYDLLNLASVTNDALLTEIDTAITSAKEKYKIASNVNAEFAVVKLNPGNTSQIIGIDLLRNIELFQTRNWFDADGNTRSTGAEITTTTQNSLALMPESTLYLDADQTFYTTAGMNYAGSANGTSGVDTSNLQTTLETMLTAYPQQSNNNRGLIYSDQAGDDTVTGTNFNDFFWLSGGNDIIQGGPGTQDRAALYWSPSTANLAAAASIAIDNTTAKTIKVNQVQNGTTTELVRFTLNDSNTNDKYWTAEQKNTSFAYSFSGVGTSFGTDTLRGVEQAVFVLPTTMFNDNGTTLITLTGLTSNNILVVDLPIS
jgi:hypothetical protein